MGAKKKGAGKAKSKGKKEKKPKDATGEAFNEVEEAERKVKAAAQSARHDIWSLFSTCEMEGCKSRVLGGVYGRIWREFVRLVGEIRARGPRISTVASLAFYTCLVGML